MKLVDTSGWIEFLRGSNTDTAREVLELISRSEAAWCDIIAVELWNGVTYEQRAKLRRLENLVTPLPISGAVWKHAKLLASAARKAAHTVPVADLVIAACAREHRLKVLHHSDEHLEILMKLNLDAE